MERTGNKKYKPDVCTHCGQTTEYVIPLSKGAAVITIAIANAVRKRGENKVPIIEILYKKGEYPNVYAAAQDGRLLARAIGSASQPRYHGLIASVKKGSGLYLLTPKGAKFLRGESVARLAVIDKIKSKNKGYLDEQTERTTIRQLLRSDQSFWDLEWEIDEQTLALKKRIAAARDAVPQAQLSKQEFKMP